MSNIKISLIAFGLAFGTSNALAQNWTVEIPHNKTEAYVHATDGNIVRTNDGGCVRSIYWSKDTAIAACEGKVAVKPKPVAKPKPEPVVEAPKPVAKPAPVVVAPKPAPAISKEAIAKPLAFSGFFATGGANLTADAQAKLDDYVEYLKAEPKAKIRIEGHTDSRGSAAGNQRLSLKRAQSVKSYLESQGISADRVQAVGAGEVNPVADNNTALGRAANRRVELEIIQ